MPVQEQLKANEDRLNQNWAQMQELNEKDALAWTPEDEASWQRMYDECETLESANERLRKSDEMSKRLEAPVDPETKAGMSVGEQRDQAGGNPAKDDPVDNALRQYLLRGDLPDEYRGPDGGFQIRMGGESHQNLLPVQGAELRKRAMSVGTGAQGGSTVGQMRITRWEDAQFEYNPVRAYAEVIPTENGQTWPWPTVDDSGTMGRRIAENTAANDTTIATGTKNIYAFIYTSDEVAVSRALLQDSDLPIDSIVGTKLAERIAKIQNAEYTNTAAGGGADTKPEGAVAAAHSAAGALTTATIAAVNYEKLVDIEASLREFWLTGAAWYTSRQMRAALMKIRYGPNEPYVFQRDPTMSPFGTIMGYPIRLLNEMTYANGSRVLLFGDMRQYKVRDVMTVELLRLNEVRAREFAVSFIAYARGDGRLMYAGAADANPLVALTATAIA